MPQSGLISITIDLNNLEQIQHKKATPWSGLILITERATHGQGINYERSPEGVESFVLIEKNNPCSLKFNPFGAINTYYSWPWVSPKVIEIKCFKHFR